MLRYRYALTEVDAELRADSQLCMAYLTYNDPTLFAGYVAAVMKLCSMCFDHSYVVFSQFNEKLKSRLQVVLYRHRFALARGVTLPWADVVDSIFEDYEVEIEIFMEEYEDEREDRVYSNRHSRHRYHKYDEDDFSEGDEDSTDGEYYH